MTSLDHSQIKRLQQAADLNNSDAQYALAGLYERTGTDVGISPADAAQAALDLYAKSAQAGHMGSALRLKRLQQRQQQASLENTTTKPLGLVKPGLIHDDESTPLRAASASEQQATAAPPRHSAPQRATTDTAFQMHSAQQSANPLCSPAATPPSLPTSDVEVADALGDPEGISPARQAGPAGSTFLTQGVSTFSWASPSKSVIPPSHNSAPPPTGPAHAPPLPGQDVLSDRTANEVWCALQALQTKQWSRRVREAMSAQPAGWSDALRDATRLAAASPDKLGSSSLDLCKTADVAGLQACIASLQEGVREGGAPLDPLAASTLLAWAFLGGVPSAYNPYKGMQLAVAASMAGGVSGRALVAWARRTGRGCDMDVHRAAADAMAAAEAGHSAAAYELSNMFRHGRGVESCSETARHWLVRAARQRHPAAAAAMAHLRLRGVGGVPCSRSAAMRWWGVAARNGGGGSARRLALALHREHGTATADVLHWLEAAALTGDVESLHFLGSMTAPRNRAAGLRLQLLAAAAGNAAAAKAVAAILYNASKGARGSDGSSLEAASAVWLRRAAEAGDPAAMHQAALQLGNAPGNAAEAFQLQLAAAKMGHASAATAVSQAFHQGKGTMANKAAARKWLQQAARLGCAVARQRMAQGAKQHKRST